MLAVLLTFSCSDSFTPMKPLAMLQAAQWRGPCGKKWGGPPYNNRQGTKALRSTAHEELNPTIDQIVIHTYKQKKQCANAQEERFIGTPVLIKVGFSLFWEVRKGFPEEVTFELRIEGCPDGVGNKEREEQMGNGSHKALWQEGAWQEWETERRQLCLKIWGQRGVWWEKNQENGHVGPLGSLS